ncbi:MAG: hypothetical protein QOG80_2611 [Pseudonocardiales bacterium]|nr:hypothetical protein [Pseudonocardiales bacterium]
MRGWPRVRRAHRLRETVGADVVGWLSGRKRDRAGTLRTGTSADLDHLESFVQSRGSVEAYVEPRTAVTETTVVLVASTGEWTRRRVPSADAARSFARKHAIPIYDVAIVGYPKRMRDWTAQRKAAGQLGPPGSSEAPA